MTVGAYLAKVYPTAADQFIASSETASRIFDSLHSYYDHGCDLVGKCGTPGVVLRGLYDDML